MISTDDMLAVFRSHVYEGPRKFCIPEEEFKRMAEEICHKFYEMATVDRAKIAELEAKVKVYEAILENSNFKMAVLKDKKTGGER